MNKARRMVALQARALAAAGLAVMQVDLLGCGDSAEDFEQASWEIWCADVRDACEAAMERHAEAWPEARRPPLWLWGLRAGCLLAVSASSSLPEPCHFLLWQPQGSGRQALQQFLRLRIAADMATDAKGLGERLRQELADGGTVDVAGYRLSSQLAQGLQQATLDPPKTRGMDSRSLWFELRLGAGADWMPVTEASRTKWKDAGWTLGGEPVAGPSFWSTVEIEVAPALVEATVDAMVNAIGQ